jgi:nitrogen-specific signal transduction histidine kinase/ActR/RegA family two-component response regulator
VFGPEGRLANILSVSRDVTHEQNLEEQLRHSQKMEAIGTLAGGIAHDFNNILSAIMGYTELAAMEVPGDSVAAERLRHVIHSCDRARSLVKQILTFSRKNPQEQTLVNINSSVREAVKLLRASVPSTIEIRYVLCDSDCLVMADPTQLHQLIINLCTNAAQAMEETGGILTISLDRCGPDLNREICSSELPAGTYVHLTVRDTGPGIEAEIKDRIFEPFFTTKAIGKGTGMGLAVAHGIVKSYGGCIYADSRPGMGAAFHVLLPHTAGPTRATASEKASGPQRGTETILLVDDEEPVVKTCDGMLSSLGYRVVSTTSSIKALEMFTAEPERFDCVLTDMTMPHMRGDALARKLMDIRPGVPVLLCTGYSERISELKALELGIKAFLLKPHTMQELAAAVRKALDDAVPVQHTAAGA